MCIRDSDLLQHLFIKVRQIDYDLHVIYCRTVIQCDKVYLFATSTGANPSFHICLLYTSEEHFKRPVILTDYPKEIKAFYMKQNEDGKTVRAMDVLFPKIGEIIGGSEREADYNKPVSYTHLDVYKRQPFRYSLNRLSAN